MPYHIEREGSKYKVVTTESGKVVGTHPTKVQAQAQLGALYANVKDVKKDILSGGHGFELAFSTPDCQHGWSVLKMGTGQSIGCYLTKEDAQKAMDALAVNQPDVTKSDQTKQDEQDGIGSLSFWNGSFAPVMGSVMQDMRYNSTYNTPPQKDGQPSAGYGNKSDKHGRSNQ